MPSVSRSRTLAAGRSKVDRTLGHRSIACTAVYCGFGAEDASDLLSCSPVSAPMDNPVRN